jgi:hypothetical protein
MEPVPDRMVTYALLSAFVVLGGQACATASTGRVAILLFFRLTVTSGSGVRMGAG